MKAIIHPARLELSEILAGGTSGFYISGTAVAERFQPPLNSGENNTALVCAALTPLNTSFTLIHETAGSQPPLVDDADLNAWWTQHDGIGAMRYLSVWARRRDLYTGAISGQTISIYKGSAAGTLLGTIVVAAAAAGTAQPVSDVFQKQWNTSGVTPILTGASPLHFTCSSAEPDLEIVVIAIGEN